MTTCTEHPSTSSTGRGHQDPLESDDQETQMTTEHPAPDTALTERSVENDALRRVAEDIAYEHAASIDGEFGCCHAETALRAGGRAPEFDGDEFQPIPENCPGQSVLARHLAAISAAVSPPPGSSTTEDQGPRR
jgi:hypothetical protein